MLFILADVYRIATLRQPDVPPHRRQCEGEEKVRRGWFGIAGLKL